jgi:hypothetical protein
MNLIAHLFINDYHDELHFIFDGDRLRILCSFHRHSVLVILIYYSDAIHHKEPSQLIPDDLENEK